jgi:hypothetical protein
MWVQAVPKFRCRWFRTSTRGLIVLVLIIGAWLGWLVRGAHTQRDAVAAIKNSGGGVAYDWQMRNGKYNPAGKPWAPNRLTELIGIDYFCHVTDVSLGWRSTPTDAMMAHVGRLAQLQRLNVSARSLTDAGMANLAGLKQISTLNLDGTDVTRNGMKSLQGTLPSLKIYHPHPSGPRR